MTPPTTITTPPSPTRMRSVLERLLAEGERDADRLVDRCLSEVWGDAGPGTSSPMNPDTPLDRAIFSVVDLETTGTDPRTDRITEIAAVTVLGGRVVGRFQSLVDPGRPIPAIITALTGISDETVAGAPQVGSALGPFLQVLGDAVLVAHNARFDVSFLEHAMRRNLGRNLEHPSICTLRLTRRLLPKLPRKSLGQVALHLGIKVNDRHRAGGDADATAEVLLQYLRMCKDRGIRTLGELCAFEADGTLPPPSGL